MNDPAILVHPNAEVVSRIRTDAMLDGDRPAFRVSWIDWDSDFRRELRLNDDIVAIDGRSLSDLLQPQRIHGGIGQSGEAAGWAALGAVAGQEIALTVWRDDREHNVRGRLAPGVHYTDAEGRNAIAPGGPARMARDGFASTWAMWFEDLQSRMSLLSTRAWSQTGDTRAYFAEMQAHAARVEFLLARHPGAFAETLRHDWQTTTDIVRGRRADPPVDLGYREIGEQRLHFAREQAEIAWRDLLASVADRMLPAAPAAKALAPGDAVGKCVELPPITNDDIRNHLGMTCVAAGSFADGHWFILLDRPEGQRFYRTLYRYLGQINPRMPERFRYLVEVTDEPWMFVIDGRSATGLAVRPLAVLAGDDELFVDLRAEEPQFAGEAALTTFPPVRCDDADPASVVSAMIDAAKRGDEAGWRGLFAPWRIVYEKSRLRLDPAYASGRDFFAAAWEQTRRNLMGALHDARVSHRGGTRRISSADDGGGLPDIEQTEIWVDHYGLFDGEHRSYQNAGVHRHWRLQRIDGGPWRISDVQSL